MQHPYPCRRDARQILLCTLCGRDITNGSEYWICNGSCICADCLSEFARQELAACHQTRGKEQCL